MHATVLLTDYAWPDDSIEREVVEGAGFELVNGPSAPATSIEIEKLVVRHQPAGILTCWAPVSPAAIAASGPLKIVARLGVGLDNIAVSAATERGIWVTNVPDYCVEEVSDHALSFALAWTRGLLGFDRDVRAGRWDPARARLRRLADLTVGIVGFGRIGRASARKFAGIGSRVLAHGPGLDGRIDGVPCVTLETLLSQSDVVVVHAPLLPATHHLINRERIALMPRGGMLINVSRGGVVDTDALVAALESGQLSAVGLDVLESEPEVPDRLLAQPGTIITPHVAFSSDASLAELRRRAAEEVVRVLNGERPEEPRNLRYSHA